MTIKVVTGNIFTTNVKTLVNPINCEGVMGAGLALECRLRYPDMYNRYKKICEKGLIQPGLLWLYKAKDRQILNFVTKDRWRGKSEPRYLHLGLMKFIDTYESKGIDSVAFPLLGADNGGLDESKSLQIIEQYLSDINIPVEVYIYDPLAVDDLYVKLREVLSRDDHALVARLSGVNSSTLGDLKKEMERGNYCQVNQLLAIPGVGVKTLEKLYSYTRASDDDLQGVLF